LSRLIVVSNRVAPVKQSRGGSQGGLAVAVLAALKEMGGLWFGWSGKVNQEASQPDIFDVGAVTYATLDLSQRDYDEYYNGFANRTLWPLFHYRLDLTEFSRRTMAGYQRVNAFFAHRLAPLLKDDDLVWVHDYHLIPMAEQLRHMGCEQRMGFFLHIPWPALELMLALPNHKNIVQALCAYDVVGFQTEGHKEAFLSYIEREAGGRVGCDGVVHAFGRVVKVKAYPIGIDTKDLMEAAKSAQDMRQIERLRASFRDRQMIIGVDRLDYSKGLVQRFEAFEELLRSYPANRGRVVMMQIAPPSRTDVPEYTELRRMTEAIAGRVNGTYADFDWQPIRYLNKGFARPTLAGFFRHARIGFVTPLRDGMNLVAKEYVASQNPRNPGVLVLSRFAGAAQELTSAVLVNPYDVEGMAEALQTALAMPVEERKERYKDMIRVLLDNDVHHWRETFVADLQAARIEAV
jgi:trehalose 6-phosphate synthase